MEENLDDSRLVRLPDDAATMTADDIIRNRNESVTTTNGQTTEPARLQLTDLPTANESTSDFVEQDIVDCQDCIDAIILQLDKLEERASEILVRAMENDPWNPIVPLVPVSDGTRSCFEDGDFGTLDAEQVVAMSKVKEEFQEAGTATDNCMEWIRSSSSSERTNSGSTDSDEDLINLDDVHTYVILDQEKPDSTIIDSPLEEKVEEVEVFAGLPLGPATKAAFVDVPLGDKMAAVVAFAGVPLGQAIEEPFVDVPPLIETTEEAGAEFQEDAESETNDGEVYAIDAETMPDYSDTVITLPEAYGMVQEMYKLKHLRGSMEQEEGPSLPLIQKTEKAETEFQGDSETEDGKFYVTDDELLSNYSGPSLKVAYRMVAEMMKRKIRYFLMKQEEGPSNGGSETKDGEFNETDDEIWSVYSDPRAAKIENLELCRRMDRWFKLKDLLASMEQEEGQSLKSKSVSADEDAEELLENISYEVAAAVLDPENFEITVDNRESKQCSAATNTQNDEAKDDIKSYDSSSPVDQHEPKPAFRKNRSPQKPKLSVTFAPKTVIIERAEFEPNKKAASNGECRSLNANMGGNEGDSRNNTNGAKITLKEEEPTNTDLDVVSADPVESSTPPSKPPPRACGASTNVQKSYFKPTLYADFENPELARIVAKHRQKDLEAAAENQNKSPPPLKASTPHPKQNHPKQRENAGDAVRTTKPPYFLAAPTPLNNIYNVPKTGIQKWQEKIDERKRILRLESTTGAAVQVVTRSQKQPSGIQPLMSLSLSPPPGSKAKNKSKKKSKAKKGSHADQTEQTGVSAAVPGRMEQDNDEVKNASESVVVTRSSTEKPVVWTGHPTSSSKNPIEQRTQPTSVSMVPKSPVSSPITEARSKGFPEYDLGGIKEPVKILSSDELSDAVNSGREITYVDRVMFKKKIPKKYKGSKTINVKLDGGKLNNRLLEAFSSSSDSSLSESSLANRPKPKPIGYEKSKMHQMAPVATKREVSTQTKAENKRVLELRHSEIKMIKTDATETFQSPRPQGVIVKEVKKIEGHKCLFRRCKAKIGTVSMNREDATVAMKDHLWRTHKVKIDKGEEQFTLALKMEKLEKLRDSVKGTTEVLSLLKHGEFFFAVKAGVGPDDIFYYELVYLKNNDDVDVQEDIFVQHGFEIVSGEERDMELREIPVTIWDPVDPIPDNPYNVKCIPVAELKENFFFDDTISMGFRVFAISTGTKPSASAHLDDEEFADDETQIQESQDYVQRCKDSTFFGKPSFR